MYEGVCWGGCGYVRVRVMSGSNYNVSIFIVRY